MDRTQQIRKAIIVFLITIFISMNVSTTTSKAIIDSDAYSDMSEVFQYLHYYHLSGIEAEQLKTEAIDAMIEALGDRHTEYYTAEEWAQYERSLNQQYVGVGMRLSAQEEGFQVIEVFANSPAQHSGIMKGDYIIGVDDQSAEGLTLDELVDLIVGPEGTHVTLTIERQAEQLTIQSVRAEINVPQVSYGVFETSDSQHTGYIRLHSFSESGDVQFIRALTALQEREIQGLVIDVRGNPGGYLHIVASIAEQFIEEGPLIHTRDRNDITSIHHINNGQSVDFPLVVLVDGHSASASEILAVALQDYGLATIIGTQTYGKGSVQRLIPLSSGSYLKFTMEEYLSPHLHRVDGVGVQPDIEVYDPVAQLFTALHTLHMPSIDIDYSSRQLTVNGVAVEGLIDVLYEDDKVYVHSRQLAALVGGQVEWHAASQSVGITVDGNEHIFSTSLQGIKLIAGKSYVDLDKFAEAVEPFSWESADQTLNMRYN